MGFVVTVYGELRESSAWKDVLFKHHSAFDPLDRRGALICSRIPEIADRPINAAVRLLWCHDVDFGPRMNPRRAEAFDHVLTLSGWHTRHVKGRYPFLADKIVQTRNGVERSYFDPLAWDQREPRVLYTSSPDRGLDVLLGLWPRVLEQVPDAELHHCYADVYNRVADQDPALAKFREGIRELAKQPGVVSLPSLGQRDLAKLMCSSRVWAHPSWMGMVGAALMRHTRSVLWRRRPPAALSSLRTGAHCQRRCSGAAWSTLRALVTHGGRMRLWRTSWRA